MIIIISDDLKNKINTLKNGYTVREPLKRLLDGFVKGKLDKADAAQFNELFTTGGIPEIRKLITLSSFSNFFSERRAEKGTFLKENLSEILGEIYIKINQVENGIKAPSISEFIEDNRRPHSESSSAKVEAVESFLEALSPQDNLSSLNLDNIDEGLLKEFGRLPNIADFQRNIGIEGVVNTSNPKELLKGLINLCHGDKELMRYTILFGNQSINGILHSDLWQQVKIDGKDLPHAIVQSSGNVKWTSVDGVPVCTANYKIPKLESKESSMGEYGQQSFYFYDKVEKRAYLVNNEHPDFFEILTESKKSPLVEATLRLRLEKKNNEVVPVVECLQYKSAASNVGITEHGDFNGTTVVLTKKASSQEANTM